MKSSLPAPPPQWVSWVIWLGFALGICICAAQDDFKRTVVHSYRGASLHWLHSEPIYDLHSIHGFLYLPSSAALTSPLALLPKPAHEVIWRLLSLAALAYAVRRMARVLSLRIGRNVFFGITLLTIPVAVGSATAGQMNLLLAATMTLTVVAILEKRWNEALLWMTLGFALKPQMLVLILLVSALHRPLWWRGAAALALALLVPFLLQRPDYVAEQYRLCWEKLQLSGRPLTAEGDLGQTRFNDLYGLLDSLGLHLQERLQWGLRVTAALATLGISYFTMRRRDALHAGIAILALAGCYLMLFNPRTEGGSYIVTALPLAAYAVWALDQEQRWPQVAFLSIIALGWAFAFDLARLLNQLATALLHPQPPWDHRYWLPAFLCVIFTGYVLWVIAKYEGPRAASTPSPSGRGPG